MRVKAVIAYDGSAFYGFQRQTTTPLTVTYAIEKVLKQLQIETPIVGSGRTDRGVHATGQVIHFDLPPYWQDLEKLKHILNKRLDAVSFRHLTFVSDKFHARFSAKRRLYRYFFKTTQPSVFERNYISHYSDSFDRDLLYNALACFTGKHDFRYFYKSGSEVHTTIRNVYHADYYCYGTTHVIIFEANGFLRSQVRMMVEAAMQCAQDKLSLEALKTQLSCEKQYISAPAPAQGLYLAKIYY